MQSDEFRKWGHIFVDWIADYMDSVDEFPVRSQASLGDVKSKLPMQAPQSGESMEDIFEDFKDIILPGITHWQHPRFFAYFPANVSGPAGLADMLLGAFGINAMLWETSPAATELEEQMVHWLGDMMQLPSAWSGVIQDTASSATFCAVLTARERATNWQSNEYGLQGAEKCVYYTSAEAHSSLEKAIKMAGLGRKNIRLVPVDNQFAMQPDALADMIQADRAAGLKPTMIMATVGTTGVGASDPLKAIGTIARANDLFFHVDAAWAGTAMICPEYRALLDGVEAADSYLFNPHKWMGVNFDCTVYFVRDKQALIRTLTIAPAYLKSLEGATDFRDWGIQLGRRMRALKLWFVLRERGVINIQKMVQNHVDMAHRLAELIIDEDDFELVTGPNLSLLTFRYAPWKASRGEADVKTEALLSAVNDDGYTYLTRTIVKKRPVIRFSIGQMQTKWHDVESSWQRIKELALTL